VAVPFQSVVEPDRAVAVLALWGELELATAPQVAASIRDLVEAGFPKVEVDLSGLTFIDSTGLQTLVEGSRLASQYGCALSLVPGSDAVQRTFVLTGLDSCFTFEEPRSPRRKPRRPRAAAQSASRADGTHLRLVR
jgi:anti-sigma B factor antagonist